MLVYQRVTNSFLGFSMIGEVNHIIACLWFWAGSSGYEVTWITEAEARQRRFLGHENGDF